ncbi:hypothetical protein [Nocardia sp. NPDC057227]|uniref:hypothetical protein n=1 Tax=Nocardia sp. NPDC057227 TaxID=3346056 RepID=UPI0036278DDC
MVDSAQRRLGMAAAFLAAAALPVGLAPSAAAEVFTLRAEPGASWGPVTPFGTSCTYTLVAAVSTDMPVSFYDFEDSSTFVPGNLVTPVNGVATVRWTPVVPGTHRIMAYQTSAGGPTVDIQVGTGVDTGSGCAVPF